MPTLGGQHQVEHLAIGEPQRRPSLSVGPCHREGQGSKDHALIRARYLTPAPPAAGRHLDQLASRPTGNLHHPMHHAGLFESGRSAASQLAISQLAINSFVRSRRVGRTTNEWHGAVNRVPLEIDRHWCRGAIRPSEGIGRLIEGDCHRLIRHRPLLERRITDMFGPQPFGLDDLSLRSDGYLELAQQHQRHPHFDEHRPIPTRGFDPGLARLDESMGRDDAHIT